MDEEPDETEQEMNEVNRLVIEELEKSLLSPVSYSKARGKE